MTGCSIIITTTDKEDIARLIASELVKSRLVRCVQIDKVASIYEWEGRIEETQEHRLFIKAVDKNIEAIKKHILMVHNYELPEIVVLSITDGFDKYIKWLKS